jgi:putative ABC transport system ATP-binding protein
MIATLERSTSPDKRLPQTAVLCQGVTKEFGANGTKTLALHGVDVEVHDGQLTLLVGPSGCGKTTLISIIAGLLDPTHGTVSVLGSDLAKLTGSRLVEFRAKKHRFRVPAIQPAAGAVGGRERSRALDHQRLAAAEGCREGPAASQ